MKVLVILATFALAVSSLPIEGGEEHINGENGWYVPQLDGTLKWMNIEEGDALLEQLEASEGRAIQTVPVTFHLYTEGNPTKSDIITDTKKSISASNFDPTNPTRIAIHGWTQSYSDPMNKHIRDAWLSHGDHNIIVVDWGRARGEYATAVAAVERVGKKVAGLIDFLVKNYGMQLETLNIIGHSLGAHVAGHAGKNVKTGQVHTIVALDPALPLFKLKSTAKRLTDTDALYVEVFHTNAGGLGFLKPIGNSDFYPNGGKSQPGCSWDLTGACSHGRSITYYVEAIENNNFPTMKCDSYKNAVKKSCGSTFSPVRMGSVTNALVVKGEFYVPVNKNSPFGMAA